MDKFSHTILYADDTNIIAASTNYNDWQKKKEVNLTLQFIFEWFKINKLVLNKNKTFGINFSFAETPTHTLNIILYNQNLSLIKLIKFLGIHLDSNLSWKLHIQK